MKVIKNSKLNPKESASSPMGDVIGSIKSGLNLSEGIQAEDAVIASLERMLDNRYVILRDVTLPGLKVPIPLVLVGPTGVRVLNPNSMRGIYRAQGENWEQMDDRRQDFKPAQPNLIMRAQLMARAVEKFLTGQGYELPEVEPVLVFTEPGVHIETVRPVVRVILIDGLERFTAGLAQGYPILEKEDVQKIADLFSDSMGLKNLDASAYPEQDVFSFTDEEAETNPSWLDQIPAGEGIVSTLNKIPFSSRQWLLLGTMMIVNVFVLLTFILLVLVS
jgi:hypothetical protein